MKKKLFKVYALLLIVSMAFSSCLFGCRKSDEDTQAKGSGTKATASAGKTAAKSMETTKGTSTGTASGSLSAGRTPSTSEQQGGNESEGEQEQSGSDNSLPSEYAVEKTFDLQGRVIRVICSLKESLQWPVEDGTRLGEVRTKMVKEAEEKFNCKFAFELFTSWEQLQSDVENSVMAGVYYADVVRMQRTIAFPKWEKNNIILPLNDYIDFDQPVYKQYDQIHGLLNPDKIYSFFICGFLTPIGVFYNKDLLAREGLPDIHELADNGQWNWETFADMAMKLTHDFNGDGIIDQWGAGADNSSTMCISFMRSNLAAMIDRTDDNKFVYNLYDPKALRALQFVSDLYTHYKVIPSSSVLPYFQKGQAAMYIKDAWYGANLQKAGLTNFGFEIMPDGPDNPGTGYMREQGSHMFFFPSNIKDPEGVVNAVAYWNVLWDESKSDYLTVEDMLLSGAQTYFTSEEDIDNFIDIMKTRKIYYDYIGYFDPAQDEMRKAVFYPISVKASSPVSSIESLRSMIENIIEDALAK